MSTRRNARSTAPPSGGEESATEKLVRMQENINQKKAEAERARQATIEAERVAREQELAIAEEERRLVEELAQAQKEEEEAAKKREEEAAAAAAAEEEKKAEAKRKTAEGRKRKVAGPVDTKGKGRARATDDNEGGDGDEDTAKGPKKKAGPRTGTLVNDAGKNISNEIVQGVLYPSCMACAKVEQPCQWKQCVIHLRLAGVPNKAKNCEDCVRKQVACQFVWERDESLKRAAEEYQTSEAHKRTKFDGPDMVSCMQSIDKNIGTLVKFMVTQATQSSDNHQMTSDALGSLTDSLEGIRQKYTGK